MVKRLVVSLFVIFLLGLAGCSASAMPTSAPSRDLGVSSQDQSAEKSLTAGTGVQPAAASNTSAAEVNQQVASSQRIVIMNATLAITLKDPAAGMDAVAAMAKSMGGFVVSSNLYRSQLSDGTEVPTASITVRVPAEKLTEALQVIKGLVADPAKDIRSENVSGQDVTKEYTDLQSQLTNLQSAEKQLQAIMENATKTDDVLAIFNQLTQIRGQIEVIKGQIKFYEESSATSAITVEIASTASIKPLSIGGWQPVGVARDALQALIVAFQWIANLLIYVGLFCLPITIVLGLPLFFLIRGFTRWNKRRKSPKPSAVQPPAGG
jgi:hypothetical protein